MYELATQLDALARVLGTVAALIFMALKLQRMLRAT